MPEKTATLSVIALANTVGTILFFKTISPTTEALLWGISASLVTSTVYYWIKVDSVHNLIGYLRFLGASFLGGFIFSSIAVEKVAIEWGWVYPFLGIAGIVGIMSMEFVEIGQSIIKTVMGFIPDYIAQRFNIKRDN